MKTPNLDRFTAELERVRAEEAEKSQRRELKRVVKQVLPKHLTAPKRPRGRTPSGGLSRKELAKLRTDALEYLGAGGLPALEAKIQHTALVILLIDGLLGTEPWRAAGMGGHAGLISANARLRYLENASRLLADLRASRQGDEPDLLQGVIDAEPVDPPAALPAPPEDPLGPPPDPEDD